MKSAEGVQNVTIVLICCLSVTVTGGSKNPKILRTSFKSIASKEGHSSSVDRSSGIKMDSRIGLDYIVENSEYTAKLGSGQSC